MTKRIRVGVLGTDLIGWGGGVDFLRLMLGALALKPAEVHLVLLLPRLPAREDWPARALKGFRDAAGGGLINRIKKAYWAARERAADADERQELLWTLRASGAVFQVRDYAGPSELRAAVQATGLEVLIPSIRDLGADFPIPWVGYLPDIQHRRLPEMFDLRERALRDSAFAALLKNADAVILTSNSVRSDVKEFYGRSDRCVALSLACLPLGNPLTDISDIKRQYDIGSRYFIVCNQFWKHKAHATAIEALRILRRDSDFSDLQLICTGVTSDYRHPEYFHDLKQRIEELRLSEAVKILGRVPKDHQLSLIAGSVALIQPSLFEGTQGGLSVSDAITVGARSLVSDIQVNLEINHPLVRFFRAGSPEDMAKSMRVALFEPPPPRLDHAAQVRAARPGLLSFGDGLVSACRIAVQAREAPTDVISPSYA